MSKEETVPAAVTRVDGATDAAANLANNWNPGEVLKSGWLWRQSSVLKRWKKAWFVLHTSGRLAFHEDQNSPAAADNMHIPADRALILSAAQVDVTPPEGYDKSRLFGLKTKKATWYLCAEDVDDLTAWQLSLADAVNISPMPYGQYQGWTQQTVPEGMRIVYPEQVEASMTNWGVYDPDRAPLVISTTQGVFQAPAGSTVYLTVDGPVIVDQQGRQTLIMQDGRYCHRGHDGSDFLLVAALGSMLMWPWLFWMPLFWW